jgi:dephospho-CoA kinase
VVVDLDPEVAIARLIEHRGFTEEDARARIGRQVSREDRLAKATKVLRNHGSIEELVTQVDDLWPWMQSLDQVTEPERLR